MIEHKKLRFFFENSNGDHEVETMWALIRDDGYEIDNIPFYVTGLALGDVVSAETEADGGLRYSALVRASGHSTVQLLFQRETDVSAVRDDLKRMGCSSEGSDLPGFIAVDVPPDVAYDTVKAFLDAGERAGTFEYQEACLGFPREERPESGPGSGR